MMDRRAFIGTLAGGLLAAPLATEAQQSGAWNVALIGYLFLQPLSATAHLRDAFRQGHRELGYMDAYKEAQTAPYGIPAGEVPITLYIVGAKEQCDRAEARFASLKGTGVGIKAISDPCHGPFYFKKDR